MKILLLSDDFPPKSFGGAGIVAYMQAKELSKRGHEVDVITAEEKDRAEEIMREFKPDVIHAHNVHVMGWDVLSLARNYTPKLIITLHDTQAVHYSKIYPRRKRDGSFDYKVSAWHQLNHFWKDFRPSYRSKIKKELELADRIFAVSKALKEALEQNGLRNIEVMHNGIEASGFKAREADVENFKNKHDLQGKRTLLFAGRLGAAKGSDIAERLIEELPEDVRLLMVGKADKESKSKKIIYTGWLSRDEVRTAYGVADIVLSLSVYLDPFPTVNLEGMAAGKPVIGTIYGGTPEVVKDGVTGFLVDPLNLNQVIAKTGVLLNDPALREKMGEAGRNKIIKNFNLGSVVDKLEEAYR